MLLRINNVEALADWMTLHTSANDLLSIEDGMMVISKLFQQGEDLLKRSSSDDIYDEINLQLDTMTSKDLRLRDLERVEEFGGQIDLFLLDKVLKNRKGVHQSYLTIASRVTGCGMVAYHEGFCCGLA